MKEKTNKKLDLIWIIPEIIGELFIIVYIPIQLIGELNINMFFTPLNLLYVGVIYLLIGQLKNLTGFRELSNVKWKE